MATICSSPSHARLYLERQLSAHPLPGLFSLPDRVIVVSSDRRASSHRWLPYGPLDATPAQPFHIDTERPSRHIFGVPLAEGPFQLCGMFVLFVALAFPSRFCDALLPNRLSHRGFQVLDLPAPRFAVGGEGPRLFSCGYWDNSIKCSLLDGRGGQTYQTVHAHSDVVTCLALAEDGSTLLSGSRDTTLMLTYSPMRRHRLHGHDDEVLCVCLSSSLDLATSGSRDGSAILYTLRSGQRTPCPHL
ncbi:MAG: hypothetical protein SGPRY_004679 [Prymnesium sp.]